MKHYKLLIIEDDEIIRKELKILLEKNGYDSVAPDEFDQIPQLVETLRPHLILLDLSLPGIDGYYLCREIRKNSDVPIIIVTSRNNEMDELVSLNCGADQFVTKPYHAQILLAKIMSLLNRVYETSVDHIIYFKDLALDLGKSRVSYGSSFAELTRNELYIMKTLVEAGEEIVSRDDLMNALWQTDLFIDDNTLTVNISRLRNKLNEIGVKNLIKTRRGMGYSL